jgi:hypothetical protein
LGIGTHCKCKGEAMVIPQLKKQFCFF